MCTGHFLRGCNQRDFQEEAVPAEREVYHPDSHHRPARGRGARAAFLYGGGRPIRISQRWHLEDPERSGTVRRRREIALSRLGATLYLKKLRKGVGRSRAEGGVLSFQIHPASCSIICEPEVSPLVASMIASETPSYLFICQPLITPNVSLKSTLLVTNVLASDTTIHLK